MKSKPLYRSLTFWSGILVMGFIFWGWRDSMSNVTVVWAGKSAACNVGGGVLAGRGHDTQYDANRSRSGMRVRPGSLSWRKSIEFDRAGAEEPYLEWPMPQTGRSYDIREVFIPHWLLLLAVALPWSGLLLWRARRIRRAVVAFEA